jgi:hypothetical protein
MAFLRRHSLVIGLVLMYLFTWSVYLSAAGILPVRLPRFVYPFANSGFAFAAILMTWLTLGPRAVLDLLKRFLLWRLGWKWYASLLIILTYLLASQCARWSPAPDFGVTTARSGWLVGNVLLPAVFCDVGNIKRSLAPRCRVCRAVTAPTTLVG